MSLPLLSIIYRIKFIRIISFRAKRQKINWSKILLLCILHIYAPIYSVSFRISVNFSFAYFNVINIFFKVFYCVQKIKCVRVQGSKRSEAAIFYRWMIYFMNISLYKQAFADYTHIPCFVHFDFRKKYFLCSSIKTGIYIM